MNNLLKSPLHNEFLKHILSAHRKSSINKFHQSCSHCGLPLISSQLIKNANSIPQNSNLFKSLNSPYKLSIRTKSRSATLASEELIEDPNLIDTLKLERGVYVRRNNNGWVSSIPTEKDLIDGVETEFCEESASHLNEEAFYENETIKKHEENPLSSTSSTKPKSKLSKSKSKSISSSPNSINPITSSINSSINLANSNTPRKLRKEEREKIAKIKRNELEKAGREASLNMSLSAYIDLCIFSGQLNKGLSSLNFYRGKSKGGGTPVTDIRIFNALLHAFAAKRNYAKVCEIFSLISEDNLKPTPQSYAAILECLARTPSSDPSHSSNNLENINKTIYSLTSDGFSLNDLFNKCTYTGSQREYVLEGIRRVDPDFNPQIIPPHQGYVSPLLTHLNNKSSSTPLIASPARGLLTKKELEELGKKQLHIELHGTITVKSIEKKDDKENIEFYRGILETVEEEWKKSIDEAYRRNLNTLIQQSIRLKNQRAISLFPFLKVLSSEDCVKIILQEIRKLAEGSETYSPSITQLHRELGSRVLSRYEISYKKQGGILDKIDKLYKDYLAWYLRPENEPNLGNSREKWQKLVFDPLTTGPDVDIGEKEWPNSVLCSIGRFLYGIIMRDIKIDANIMKLGTSKHKIEQVVPGFYSIFRMQGVHLKEELKPHPTLVKLFQAASRDELIFDSSLVPMISPPLPWASIQTGGYLLSAARIVRLPHQAHQQKTRLQQSPPAHLYPSLDSLNQLAAVPWKINSKVLQIVIQLFNDKGSDELGVPPPPSECPPPLTMEAGMSKEERGKVHRSRMTMKRKRGEMYSLWCDALYKLSLANHFKESIFWFPHNMDFRGRVYPCPPHLNHLGSDVARAILVFALGEQLGPKGLDWLKIHLVNLTGLKKREPISGRLAYANEMMDEILDSAANPLTGRKWWSKSEEPWQTLACCIEISNAINSGDPSTYVSHFPIQQDGSCNGLQHYAALGRDEAGAESVNLTPRECPMDVYQSVATLVERQRSRDEASGVQIAGVLRGFIKRKVIKQTVMTTVYGVTRYGARLQIAKQLKDIPDFPQEHLWPASLYLVSRTFDSLQEMFSSTKEIQDWFTESARLISQTCGQNVEWLTPLALPVVQPYFKQAKKTWDAHDPIRLRQTPSYFDSFERPNVMKQKNAFPPNFIHSLDSTHMMLTSLHCERAKITYVSVHDCYWTHPKTVEIMNKICREQFVALHSQPILEDLSKFLVKKYSYSESEMSRDGSAIDMTKNELNRVLRAVPKKGPFDLTRVLDSIYFFS